MSRSWGVYVRFGRIHITKKFDSLRQALLRYERLTKRKQRADVWFALTPVYDDENKVRRFSEA